MSEKSVSEQNTLDQIIEREFSMLVPNRLLTGPEWVAITQSFKKWLRQKQPDYVISIVGEIKHKIEYLDKQKLLEDLEK